MKATQQGRDLDRSQLFLVRVWPGRDGEGRAEWRGKLQHVVSGEAHTFRGCPALVEVLMTMLRAEDPIPVGREPPAESDQE